MLSVSRCTYGYGATPVLHDVDLSVAAGEIVCLVGPNGAGKSTLLKCINRILRARSGTIRLDGRRVEDFGRRELARSMAYVPQQVGSAMSLKVIEMVALGSGTASNFGHCRSRRRDGL